MPVGSVSHIVEGFLIVKADRERPLVDLDSLLAFSDRQALGKVCPSISVLREARDGEF